MILKAGMRLRSTADTTELVVVKAPPGDVDVRCGGQPVVAPGSAGGGGELDPAHASGSQIGKRYVDEAGTIELLCTKAGPGSLSIGAVPLQTKESKQLPSSD
jgi:hypothetical protein